jgi:hypothetical protein
VGSTPSIGTILILMLSLGAQFVQQAEDRRIRPMKPDNQQLTLIESTAVQGKRCSPVQSLFVFNRRNFQSQTTDNKPLEV